MGKRFTQTHISDQRAIDLHLRLMEIERDFPLVVVTPTKDRKKLLLRERDSPFDFNEITVETVLSFDIKAAHQTGGTRAALMTSKKSRSRVPGFVVSEDTHEFLSGEND